MNISKLIYKLLFNKDLDEDRKQYEYLRENYYKFHIGFNYIRVKEEYVYEELNAIANGVSQSSKGEKDENVYK